MHVRLFSVQPFGVRGLRAQESETMSDPMLQEIRMLRNLPTSVSTDTTIKSITMEQFGDSLNQIKKELIRKGFIDGHNLSPATRRFIVDPLKFSMPTMSFRLQGVNSAPGGGAKKYSAIDFFGKLLEESWYVYDIERFRTFTGERFGTMFKSKNPTPTSGLKCAFTRFLHGMNMHWSGCREWKK